MTKHLTSRVRFGSGLLIWLCGLLAASSAIEHDVQHKRVTLSDAGQQLVVRLNYDGRCLLDQVRVRGSEVVADTGVGSALNTAASVHLLASSTHGLTMDFKPHESPMQHEMVSDPWVQKDGCLEVRQSPGLGVTVNEKIVAKYTFS